MCCQLLLRSTSVSDHMLHSCGPVLEFAKCWKVELPLGAAAVFFLVLSFSSLCPSLCECGVATFSVLCGCVISERAINLNCTNLSETIDWWNCTFLHYTVTWIVMLRISHLGDKLRVLTRCRHASNLRVVNAGSGMPL